MGNEASKIEGTPNEIIPEGSVPSTPILTPKVNFPRELDPRSPSNNVIRTPIETILMKHKPVEGVLNVVQCTPRLKYLTIDPRSPTVDFNRTPIIVEEDEHISNIAQITLNKNRRKSGILETNLDYIETNIDEVYLEKSPLKLAIKEKCDNNIEEVQKGIDKINLDNEEINVGETFDIINNDDLENKVDVTEQPKVEENKTIFDDIPKKDLTVVINTVKDFDKKLTNLIYQDEETSDTKDVIKTKNRTALVARNLNVGEIKKIPKLKVADKPRKTNCQFSKIPISKMNKKKINNIQCENTPPGVLRERKSKLRKPEWDGDKTLVI